MKRVHKIKPDFTIDNINDINKEKPTITRQENGDLAAMPLRMIIPGLSSLRTRPTRN